MLGLELSHASKRGHRSQEAMVLTIYNKTPLVFRGDVFQLIVPF